MRSAPRGYECHMSCAVKGDPAPRVTWYRNNLSLSTNTNYHITNVCGVCSLLILRVGGQDNGEYKVVIENKLGSAECSMILSVRGNVYITNITIHFNRVSMKWAKNMFLYRVKTWTCGTETWPERFTTVFWINYPTSVLVFTYIFFNSVEQKQENACYMFLLFPDPLNLIFIKVYKKLLKNISTR